MSQRTPYYLTTPIYYVNDRPHIGSCYSTCVADVLARFQRLMGRDVCFLTGTDEHADRVVTKAAEMGMTTRQWADRCAGEFQKAFADLNITPDIFYRTSDARHKALAQSYIAQMQANGDIYLGDYVGWYDVSQDEYLTETVAKEAGYVSPVSGKPLEKRTEKNYFFRLSKYADRLWKLIEGDEEFIQPRSRRNEVIGRLRDGLQDVPVSRAVGAGEAAGWQDWGVLMPGDPGHRVYVWIEALCNYLTAVDSDERRKYWPPAVHLMAKDILWFHAVVWPCMLMSLDRPLPRVVYAHAYFVREGRKMSKSLGNFVDIDTMRAYCARYSRDAMRWYLATHGPLGSADADFAYGKFVEVFNSELANGLGNSTSRVGNMIAKYFEGRVPTPGAPIEVPGAPPGEYDWPNVIGTAVTTAITKADEFDIAGALEQGLVLVRRVDAFINATEPFRLAKKADADAEAKARLSTILYSCAEALRVATVIMSPAIPDAADRLLASWSAAIPPCHATKTLYHICKWGGEHALQPGATLSKGENLFMRADPAEAEPGKA